MVLHDKYTYLERTSGRLARFTSRPVFSCSSSARVFRPWESSQGPERANINRRGRMGSVQAEQHHII